MGKSSFRQFGIASFSFCIDLCQLKKLIVLVLNMRKSLSIVAFLAFLLGSAITIAQPRYRVFDFNDPKLKSITIHAQTGYASYFGDLCPTGDCYTKANFSFGLGVNRHINDYIFLSLNAQYYRISGSDGQSGDNSRGKRNLSFRADNFEFCLTGGFEFLNYNTFRFLSRTEFPISMFLYLGLGMTTNNPSAMDNSGNYVNLRPLQTEGVSYSPVTAIIPFGVGIGYKVLNNLHVNLTAGYRYAFTDYLDDVSTKYADPNALPSEKSREMAYRADQLDPSIPPYSAGKSIGGKRGGSNSNDGYLLVDLKVEYTLPVNPVLGILKVKPKSVKGKSTISAPTKQVDIKKKK